MRSPKEVVTPTSLLLWAQGFAKTPTARLPTLRRTFARSANMLKIPTKTQVPPTLK